MTTIRESLAIAIQHHQAGRVQIAEQLYLAILQQDSDQPDALHFLGVIAHDAGNDAAAIDLIGRAIQRQEDAAEFHYNLGGAYLGLAKTKEAIACYRKAIALNPQFSEAHFNLGLELRRKGKLGEAVASYRRALELKPNFVDGHVNLGLALYSQGKHEEAIACYVRALQLKPDDVGAHSNLLMALQCMEGISAAEIRDAHADFDRLHASVLSNPLMSRQKRSKTGRLRLGFVSADLGLHPVGYFLIRFFENLHQEQAETVCYFDRVVKDEMTFRFQAAANQWRDVVGMNDEQLAEQIRSDRIDILFDLAGHTAKNRLLVFARKPAPIQVSWAGYVGTTGLRTMDYVLADRFHIPAEFEQYYRERILCMPNGYVCYDPPADAPSVSMLPALECGHVTFGCFNNPSKITTRAIAVWARILNLIPRSRLILKYKGWNDSLLIREVSAKFDGHGIDPRRLEFQGQSPHVELLAEYHRVDLALDPFPYSGGLTTCEALWMGVPVITCPGETFASRHSLSHLSNVGLKKTIASNLDEYVELAVSLAGNLPRLTAIRTSLRNQMADSPLCDGRRFATNLIKRLQDAWKDFNESALQ